MFGPAGLTAWADVSHMGAGDCHIIGYTCSVPPPPSGLSTLHSALGLGLQYRGLVRTLALFQVMSPALCTQALLRHRAAHLPAADLAALLEGLSRFSPQPPPEELLALSLRRFVVGGQRGRDKGLGRGLCAPFCGGSPGNRGKGPGARGMRGLCERMVAGGQGQGAREARAWGGR